MASLTKVVRTQHFRLILHVLSLLAVVFVFCYSVIQTDWIGTPIISILLILMLTINIVRLVEKGNRDFAQFLNNISHNDFVSASGASSQGFSARDFVDAQKTLLSKYRKLKADRSAQSEYLHMVVEHIDSALICFDSNGKIEIINKAASNLLNKKYIGSLNIVNRLNKELGEALSTIRPGENRLLKLVINNELYQLMLSATEFVLMERQFKLVSLQNIKSALDEREIESWQKLIKVLTHEIMNSMTPIVSLSRYIETVIDNESVAATLSELNVEQFRDLQQSIGAIATRSKGLMEFVDSYRSLSNLPEPVFAEVKLTELVGRIETLLGERFKAAQIHFTARVQPRSLLLHADVNLLEQVLINLLSNAIDAVHERDRKIIELECSRSENNKVLLKITDNGCGISKQIVDNIFVPFFTTKPHGNGIGLSLSRQLTKLNGGTLSVSSIEGEGSQFTLSF